MAYTIVRTLNDWTPRGDRCNVRSEVFLKSSDPVAVGKAVVDHGIPWRPKDNSTLTVFDDTQIEPIGLIDLYRTVVGDEVFLPQLADEDFSINLDDYFRDL
jgi:hypothetical protein